MKSIFIICLLVLVSCKKEEHPLKHYTVTAVCYDKQITYNIFRQDMADTRLITKAKGQQAEYDFEDLRPRAVYVSVTTSLRTGETVKMKYLENGVVLDTITFTNTSAGERSGVVGAFFMENK